LQTNPWFFGQDHLPGQKGGSRQRLLDTAEFLHHVQNEFYGKFVKAIREAGYKGPLCGSPWQAPAMLPHYYNLYSDYLVGFIDRHNYFGGRSGQAQVSHPGGGYFSSGLQQVADRPFSLSEWITVYPSLHSADGPAIVAAYGLGLQGWDASYEFQSHAMDRSFADRAGWVPWGVWDADTPTQMGQYPALSRMVLGGDVKEAPVISRRRVAPGDFKTGTFSFSDRIAQEGDVKSFGGAVPGEALAAGRVVVEFVDKPQPAVLPDMSAYRKGSTIVSATGQLTWETADGGHIAVDTAGTKGVSGFAGGRTVKLGNVTIAPASPYASIFLTSLDQPAVKGPQGGSAARPGLDRCRSALLTAVARSCNSGFTTYAIDGRIIENGKGPILLEPVKAALQFQGRTVKAVNILDHDGRRTGRTLQAAGGRIEIDTGRDKALYYEIVFE